MDFESHSFGVKVTDTTISVEIIESLAELSKYQFLLSDKIADSYNGNMTYGINIQQLTKQEHIEFFGWKVISFSFPGNWFGQWGVCVLEDLYGKQKTITTTNQAWYIKNYKAMLKESIEKAKEFAEGNYSVDYSNFYSYTGTDFPFPPKDNQISFRDFSRLIPSTKKYIEDYQKILSTISDKKDERSILFLNTLNESFANLMKKYYPFEIKDFSQKK